jgi:hypothetical protein
MSWRVYLAYDSANNVANSTAPGARFGRIATSWPVSSALGFFANTSGGPVTVGQYAVENALLISTTTPTVQRYLTSIRPIGSTGFAVSTPGMGSTEWYFNRNSDTDFSTPKPSFGIRFAFGTAGGTVSFTAASAWFGKVSGGTVIGDSSHTGFRCALAELASADTGASPRGWEMDKISVSKMSMNCDAANGGRMRGNYTATTAVGWHLAINLAPKSAGTKTGGLAMDITYS